MNEMSPDKMATWYTVLEHVMSMSGTKPLEFVMLSACLFHSLFKTAEMATYEQPCISSWTCLLHSEPDEEARSKKP